MTLQMDLTDLFSFDWHGISQLFLAIRSSGRTCQPANHKTYLAFEFTHSSGTYDKNTNDGGSNGARMRFLQGAEANHGCNAGLNHARDVLEPIKAQFPQISYSDLWVISCVTYRVYKQC